MNIRKLFQALAVGTVLAASSVAGAAPINIGQWYTFGFSGVGSSLVGGAGFTLGTNPDSIAAPDGPWTFTLTQQAELVVLDGFIPVDQFEIFDGATSLGQTSAPSGGANVCGSDISCALANLDYSRGVFALGPGSYSISGTQIAGVPGAGFLLLRAASVPEPDILALLGMAAAALAFTRRRASKGSTTT